MRLHDGRLHRLGFTEPRGCDDMGDERALPGYGEASTRRYRRRQAEPARAFVDHWAAVLDGVTALKARASVCSQNAVKHSRGTYTFQPLAGDRGIHSAAGASTAGLPG